MLRLFIIFSSCFDKNLLEKWLEINDFGLDIIGRNGDYMEYKSDVSDLVFSDGSKIEKLAKNGFLVTDQGKLAGAEKKCS